MAASTSSTRPRQVTFAATAVMVGSALVVVSVFSQFSTMGSLEYRQSLQDRLDSGGGFGMSLAQAEQAIRVLGMVAAACATAAAGLGYLVLGGSIAARRALSVLALPLFLAGALSAGLTAALVAGAVVVLWLSPSRGWFDPSARAADRARPSGAARASGGNGPDVSGERPSWPPPLPTTPAPPSPAAPAVDVWGTPTHTSTAPTGRPERPSAVVWACAVAWGMCGLVALVMGLALFLVLVSPQMMYDELSRQGQELPAGVSRTEVTSAVAVVAAVVVVWCLAAAVLAVYAFRGAGVARVLLLVSAGLAAGLSLVAVAGSPVAAAPLLACGVTFVLLVRGPAAEWYAALADRRG